MKIITRTLTAILIIVILASCGGVKSSDISDHATKEEKKIMIELIQKYDKDYDEFEVEKAIGIVDDYLDERETTANVFAYLNTDDTLEGSDSEIEMYHEFLLDVSVVQFKIKGDK